MLAVLVHVGELLECPFDLRRMRRHEDLVKSRQHTLHCQVIHTERLPEILVPVHIVVLVYKVKYHIELFLVADVGLLRREQGRMEVGLVLAVHERKVKLLVI